MYSYVGDAKAPFFPNHLSLYKKENLSVLIEAFCNKDL